MTIDARPESNDGHCVFRPRGNATLVEAVDFVADCVAYCRSRGLGRLLIDGRGLQGIPVPSLVDRFLAVEEWARAAGGMVAVALVVESRLIDPDRFGVRVAADLGLTGEVFVDEALARSWLGSIA